MWAVTGRVAPGEPGNWITSASVEQGAMFFHHSRMDAGPFVRLTVSGDSAGSEWNNRQTADAGVKLSRQVPVGVVEAGAARRHRWAAAPGSGNILFVNLWMGWTPRLLRP